MKQLKAALIRIVPLSFAIGVSFEFFMIKTGFYDIVTRKEGERRAEAIFEERRKLERVKQLRIDMERRSLAGGGSDPLN